MKTTLVIAILVLATLATAQEGPPPHAIKGSILDAVSLPGQMWVSSGTISPFEHGDIISQSYFEQGTRVYGAWGNSLTLTPYTGFGMVLDTEGHAWNNKVQPSGGIKVSKMFRRGIISVGTAYSYEYRFTSAKEFKASGRTDYILDWFGWNPVVAHKSRFPGSTWSIIGHISPVEHGNLIEEGYVTQGVIIKRFRSKALIPYGELTLAHDSKGFDWENKAVYGGGAKLGTPIGENAYTEFGAGYSHEDRLKSGLSANGIKVFMNFSFNWSLLGRK